VLNTEQTQLSTRHDLAKLDKSKYTKAEWQKIRNERRRQKHEPKPKPVVVQDVLPIQSKEASERKNYILCLKHGSKYDPDYVNRLYNMCKRHCTIPFEFVCLTEQTQGLDPDITTIALPGGLAGWWYKPYIFSEELGLNGTILYMDLDVVLSNNIDKLFVYSPGDWFIIRDFTRSMRAGWKKYNSSVIRFETGTLKHIWTKFKEKPQQVMRQFHGDQDWIYHIDKTAKLWPDSWIRSWKWEIRKNREFDPKTQRGTRKLKYIEDVEPGPECCVCVFHGDPNPHLCDDPWVVDNWK